MLRGEGPEGPAVLCKFSQRVDVKIDEILELQQIEIRPTWKNAGGVSPESMVIVATRKYYIILRYSGKRTGHVWNLCGSNHVAMPIGSSVANISTDQRTL